MAEQSLVSDYDHSPIPLPKQGVVSIDIIPGGFMLGKSPDWKIFTLSAAIRISANLLMDSVPLPKTNLR